MTDKKRVGIVLNTSVYDKLKLVAGRYGMTVNSLMAYILGQWSDSIGRSGERGNERLKRQQEQ